MTTGKVNSVGVRKHIPRYINNLTTKNCCVGFILFSRQTNFPPYKYKHF